MNSKIGVAEIIKNLITFPEGENNNGELLDIVAPKKKIKKNKFKYCVITKTKTKYKLGNHYDDIAIEMWDDINKKYVLTVSHDFESKDYKDKDRIWIKLPVFQLGEIIVIDNNDREIGGAERKPDKWLIEYKIFNSIKKAIKKSLEVIKNEER